MSTAPVQRPVDAQFWDEAETWPRERIHGYQLAGLQRQLAYLAERSTYYRRRFRELGWSPRDLRSHQDLSALPFTRKEDYVSSLREDAPWGSMLGADPVEVRRVHFSSGTTADPTPMYWTAPDLERWADLYARMAYSQGVREHDVYQCLFSYSWFVGGLGATRAYERIGATVIPGGAVDSKRQINTIFRFGTTATGATPSFVLHLAEVAADMGRDLRDSSVRTVMVGGEPGGAVPATRRMIEERWGARCYDGYGSLEFQPIAWECSQQAGSHLPEDFLYAEVVDPDTGEAVEDGEPGVLVLTHLDKRAAPLVRWWTNDIVVRDSSRCACGRTHARLVGGVRGRADDMLIVRGVNVFPSAVEQIVRDHQGTTGEYLIVVDDDVRGKQAGHLDALKLRVEITEEAHTAEVQQQLADAIRSQLNVRVTVLPEAPGTLPRETHKSRRVVEA